jgi:hypothetical protein
LRMEASELARISASDVRGDRKRVFRGSCATRSAPVRLADALNVLIGMNFFLDQTSGSDVVALCDLLLGKWPLAARKGRFLDVPDAAYVKNRPVVPPGQASRCDTRRHAAPG